MSIWKRLRTTGPRYELINEELHIPTAPGYLHQTVQGRIFIALGNYPAACPVGEFAQGIRVIFD